MAYFGSHMSCYTYRRADHSIRASSNCQSSLQLQEQISSNTVMPNHSLAFALTNCPCSEHLHPLSLDILKLFLRWAYSYFHVLQLLNCSCCCCANVTKFRMPFCLLPVERFVVMTDCFCRQASIIHSFWIFFRLRAGSRRRQEDFSCVRAVL